MKESPWWANPIALFTLPLSLLAFVAYNLGPEIYASQWRTWKHFDGSSLSVALGATSLFALGVLLVPKPVARAWRPANTDLIRRLFWTTISLSVIGYFVWFGVAVLRGLRPYHIVWLATGQNAVTDEVKEVYMGTVSGITTLTQFGMAAVVLACLLAYAKGSWRGLRWPLVLLVILAIIRSLLNSERLAVIELVVPGVIAAAGLWIPKTAALRRAVGLMPVIGGLTLFGFFTASEYLRSWKGFYADQQSSLLEFSAARLSGYYVTALNNGACLVKLVPNGYQVPFFTLGFLWKLPVVKAGVREFMIPPPLDTAEGYNDMMSGPTNIEFNNPSGIFLPMLDYGTPLGLLYWFLSGIACGWMHAFFRQRHILGLCVFPMVGIGLMETGRVLYWAEPRAFPSIICLAVAALLLVRSAERAGSHDVWKEMHAGSAERSMA